MHSPESIADKPSLRRQLRRARRALSPAQQRRAEALLERQLARHPAFVRARRIAFYCAGDGEISPARLLRRAARMGKECYLPVLLRDHMQFQRYRPGQTLRRNHFGIPEPASRRPAHCPPWLLDLVLMPLVGFDRGGRRLGMGGGFYDRSFSFIRGRRGALRPLRLIGLAHSCQEVARLPVEPWDIPLHGIATEREVIGLAGPVKERG